MNFSRTVSYLLLLMLAVGCQKDFAPENPSASSDEKDDGIIRGELLLKLDRETADALHPARTRSGELRTGNLDFDEICRRYSVVGMERVFEDNGCAERTRKAGLDLWYTVTFEGSARQIEADFRDAPGVTHVETPVRIRRVETGTPVLVDPSMIRPAATRSVPEDYPFNDPMFEAQWPLYNDGSIVSTARVAADINILQAWEKTAGRSDIIVVVVDEGVQYSHMDLAANMWSGIGKNFCRGDNESITWGTGHGTHVAGTIAAVNNNGLGISGIARRDRQRGRGEDHELSDLPRHRRRLPMPPPARWLPPSNMPPTTEPSSVRTAGGTMPAPSRMRPNGSVTNRATKEAIDYFITYAGMSPDGKTQTGPMAGGVVIFAAGNENSYKPAYPAAYEPCISVASDHVSV